MDWIERIAIAKSRNSFTRDDEDRSFFWSHCAVGENLHLGAYTSLVAEYIICQHPEAEALLDYGDKFHLAVHENDIAMAEELYHKIEDILKVKVVA